MTIRSNSTCLVGIRNSHVVVENISTLRKKTKRYNLLDYVVNLLFFSRNRRVRNAFRARFALLLVEILSDS